MPHSTLSYPFEGAVGAFAGELVERFRNEPNGRSFLLVLDRDGNVLSLCFDDDCQDLRNKKNSLEESELPHLFWDPFDAPDYTWLSWRGIERSVMERLIGRPFKDTDFVRFNRLSDQDLPQEREFPKTWGVMF